MRFFAMLDDQTFVEIEAASWLEAMDKEPGNTVWVFSEEGLRETLANAKEVLA